MWVVSARALSEVSGVAALKRGPLIVAFLVFVLHLATNGSYGWFRDELYFIACGRHLAFGYVDQPPLIALISRIAIDLSFGSLVVFRLPAAIAHTAVVYLSAKLAERFGASGRGATITAIAVAISPTFLVVGHILTMNSFELLFWLGAAICVASIIDLDQRTSNRVWIALGAIIGLGLMNKHSMIFYAIALFVGLLISRERKMITARGLATAVAIASAIFLPHVIWQITHDFPMLELLENGRRYKNAPVSPLQFTLGQFLEQHPLNAPVWIAGLIFLAKSKYRALLYAHVALFFAMMLMEAKVYYFAPTYPVLYAAGGALADRYPRVAAGYAALMIAGGIAIAPLVIPILSPQRLVEYQRTLGFTPPRLERQRYSELPQHLSDELGWDGLVDAVARAVEKLPEADRRRAIIFTQNYGEAGAIDLLGPSRGLGPASTGHNNYFLWGPPSDEDAPVIIVGGEREEHVGECPEIEEAARTPADPFAIPYETDLPIFLCRDFKARWSQIWADEKSYH
jgi:hypothetical protein